MRQPEATQRDLDTEGRPLALLHEPLASAAPNTAAMGGRAPDAAGSLTGPGFPRWLAMRLGLMESLQAPVRRA